MELEPFVFRHEGVLVGTRDGGTVADTIDEVNAFTLRPLTAEEFAVFTLDLCNNRIDRHFSRFPEEELERINRVFVDRELKMRELKARIAELEKKATSDER